MTNPKFNASDEIGSALNYRTSKLLSDTFPNNHSVCEYHSEEQTNSFVFTVHTETDDLKDTSNPVVEARIHVHIHEITSTNEEDTQFIQELREGVHGGSSAHTLIEKLIKYPDLLNYVSEYDEYTSEYLPTL